MLLSWSVDSTTIFRQLLDCWYRSWHLGKWLPLARWRPLSHLLPSILQLYHLLSSSYYLYSSWHLDKWLPLTHQRPSICCSSLEILTYNPKSSVSYSSEYSISYGAIDSFSWHSCITKCFNFINGKPRYCASRVYFSPSQSISCSPSETVSFNPELIPNYKLTVSNGTNNSISYGPKDAISLHSCHAKGSNHSNGKPRYCSSWVYFCP